ncbi:phytoene desaturase [Corynebacterium sp. 3HC-13]|uniref:phytoene desaturase family protein n=1 Tax=Corynebacterium poyangense TaxID=2684405 RepID=UPI001CCBD382|nr:phytoene desaturase family protein [Corynebacterium poyangense]MBZ8176858.1 phytoene desaturase [Corynebacterium poyangense]
MPRSLQPGTKIVVIGGGVAGLASAALLADHGADVCVVDNGRRLGGRAGKLELADYPGFRWDTGPSWFLMPDAFEHFYQLLGTSIDQELTMTHLEPGYRLFPENDHPVDIPRGIEAVAQLAESFESGAGQKMREYLTLAGEVYEIACQRFLYTTFSTPAPFLHPIVIRRLGLLLQLLGRSLESWVNQNFNDTRLRQMLKYPAVFLSGEPRSIPALYHLMSHTDLVQGVRYPQGGFAAVIDSLIRLCQQRGVTFRLRTSVQEITWEASRSKNPLRKAHATGVNAEEQTPDGPRKIHLDADYVVSTVDLHHSEMDLLPAHLRTWNNKHFRRVNPGISAVLVMAGVTGSLPELEHHNLFFSHNWEVDFDQVRRPLQFRPGEDPVAHTPFSRSVYVSKTSATEHDVAPAGHENLFILVPVVSDPRLGHGNLHHQEASASVSYIQDQVIELISRRANIPDLRSRIVIAKTLGPADFLEQHHSFHGGAIGPAHTLVQSAFFRGAVRSSAVDNLFFAGATTRPGVGVPMCLISAENVLKAMTGDRTSGPRKSREQ